MVKPDILMLTMVIQTIMVILLVVLDGPVAFCIGLGIIIFILGSTIIYKNWFKDIQDNWNKLFRAYRFQRHDFNNHLQVIYTMVQMKKFDNLISYIKKIISNDETVSKICNIQDPRTICDLLELINTFRQKNIDVSLEINGNLYSKGVRTSSLNDGVNDFIGRLSELKGRKEVKIILSGRNIQIYSESLHESLSSQKRLLQ